MAMHKRRSKPLLAAENGGSLEVEHLDAPPGVVPELSRSVAHQPLPPVPPCNLSVGAKAPITLVLFYQYVEPLWTDKEHREAIKTVLHLAEKHAIKVRCMHTHAVALPARGSHVRLMGVRVVMHVCWWQGRGRCAREGLNCSLTGTPLGVS